MRGLGIEFAEVKSPGQGLNMLRQGEVEAIVFEAPTLQYWAAKRGQGVVRVVGPVFRPEKYGIAVANGNPLRKKINKMLLTFFDDGTYEALHNKWFAGSR